MKKLIPFILLAAFFFASCKKLEIPTPSEPENPGKVTKFSDIKTNPNFNWSTEKELTIKINGLKTLSPVRATLLITSTEGKSIIYSGNHLMEETFTLKSKVSISLKEVKLNFGSIQKVYSISGNTLEMDYVVNVPEEGE
jgi:hypothetical protein